MNLRDFLTITNIMNKLMDCPMNTNTAMKIIHNFHIHQEALDQLEKFKKDLIRSIGKEDKENDSWHISDSNQEEFIKKINAKLDEEINLEIHKINISELEDIKISPSEIINLQKIWLEC